MKTQKQRTHYLLTACASFMLLATAGCGTLIKPEIPTPNGNTPVVNTPPENPLAPSSEMHAALNASIQSIPGNNDSQAVSSAITQIVTDFLVAKGFVIDETQPDVVVGLTSTKSLFDQSGNYYVYDGTVLASAHLPEKTRIIATKSFSARGERKLDVAPAEKTLVEALAPSITKWLDESLTLQRLPVAARDITVHRRSIMASSDTEYIASFTSRVGSMPGVLRCTLKGQNDTERNYTFRVVYKSETFPEGLLNAIIVKCPELKLNYQR